MNGRSKSIAIAFSTNFDMEARDMSKTKTDIYASREQVQQTADDPRFRKGRRHRSSSLRTFDEHERRRRGKNAGFRRLLHLSRKSDNEKRIWWGALVVIVVLLAVIGLWQFLYVEHVARKQSRKNEMYIPVQNIPAAESTPESAPE
jgi:hypothetical protein